MKLMVLSLGLLSVGVALPFLMVIRLLEPSFVLSFLAYAASLAGVALGTTVAIQRGSSRGRGQY
ncbi:MAG: hypothetical protein ACE5Q6_15665 [Dehalococcoidia bacterium]